jgi:fructokinase
MRSKVGGQTSLTSGGPVSVGAGFLALDWLLVGDERIRPNQSYAGGSCGNVMAILAFLGWQSFPVARLGRDSHAQQLTNDLHRWNVRTDFVLRREHGATPVIIVRVRETRPGVWSRRFEWKHPASGSWLPRYRPVPKSMAQEIAAQLPASSVFYFDRAELSTLVLARIMRDSGAVVFFEPSSARDLHLFSECLALSDIVKYSAERIPEPSENPMSRSPRLEIQTLGAMGLRYRLKSDSVTPGPWRQMPAYPAAGCVDATGCGDWCSAGLINTVCQNGRTEFLNSSEAEIIEGLRYGQALAAVNCQFMAARGPMYELTKEEIGRWAKQLIQRYPPKSGTTERAPAAAC